MSGITEAFFSVKIDALPRDAGREFTVGVRSASNACVFRPIVNTDSIPS